jgi:LacI family transcriptional regulator
LHDDELAAGLVTALLDAGISVPNDISVVGFDNIDASAHFRVPLSSIDVPVRKMVDVALGDICGERVLKGDLVMDGRLILRNSVTSPATANA